MSNTLHKGTTFLITTRAGEIDPQVQRGTGLYYEDSRFLSQYQLLIDDLPLIALSSKLTSGSEAMHFLVNPRLGDASSKRIKIREQALSVTRRQILDHDFEEKIEIQNFGDDQADFTLSIRFKADFENIFVVKSAIEQSGKSRFPSRKIAHEALPDHSGMICSLDIHDLNRETILRFTPKPDRLREHEAFFRIKLPRLGCWSLQAKVEMSANGCAAKSSKHRGQSLRVAESRKNVPELETDHAVLARAYSQAVHDMASLRFKAEETKNGPEAIAAGIPWYMALFGRDSLIASFQAMVVDPSLARGTLRSLADLQGTKLDPVSMEAPGKILHEDRHAKIVGNSKTIPKFPYFGTIDATVLFLITLSEYIRFTGDFSFGEEMWPHVERALHWMRAYGDKEGDGLLEYALEGKRGLSNQGWKDSWDSIRFQDGKLAKGPIALIEVQGYSFSAYSRISELALHFGKKDLARSLQLSAEKIQEKIIPSFWLKDRNFFAEALDGAKTPVNSLTSNPGHLLWCGALPKAQAGIVAKRLVSDEMFSGYGVRTMGKNEGGYNPVSYHNGSVWPHDNSLIVSGMTQYGFHDEARRIIEGLLSVLNQGSDHRFPELFTGFDRSRYGIPIEYPSACKPQAWASGAVLLIVRSLLGLEVNAVRRTVSCNPTSISGMSFLRLKGIRICGVEVKIEVKVENKKATARILGLPSDWNQSAAA